MISNYHEKQVVLGKEAERREFVEKVDAVAESIFNQNILINFNKQIHLSTFT